jgi:phenylacetate-CoA ligase
MARSFDPERLYSMLPLWGQNAAVSAAGLSRNRRRYGATYRQMRQYLSEFDRLDLKTKEAIQSQLLHDFVEYARQNSALYSQLYRDVPVGVITSLDVLRTLPILEKETLRSRIQDAYTIPSRGAVVSNTGGTTGKSLTVRLTVDDSQRRMAFIDHFKARVGFENRVMRRATFNGQHVVTDRYKGDTFWRYNAPTKQMIFSSFHLSEKNLPHYVRGLNEFKPHAIDGFFNSMCDVASFMAKRDMRLAFRPVAIFPTAETVTAEGRALLERVFEAPVYNQYSSSEGAPFVTECKAGRLHIEMASGVIEPLDHESDEILVTSFFTHGTPLIRYRIGDSMKMSSATSCPCGIESPQVERILGRSSEFLYRADGGKIGHVGSLFKDLKSSIVQAQFVQSRKDSIALYLVVDRASFSPRYMQLIRNRFVETFGQETELQVELVDEIPRAKSGKYRFIINTVDDGPSDLQDSPT